jgi:two-component system CheB/CheR fusion protein
VQGTLLHANQRARELFSLTRADLGRPLQDLEFSYRPLELRSRIEESFSAVRTITVPEVEWRSGDDLRYFDVQVIPLGAPDGDLRGISLIFMDVSRARVLQDALQSSKRELETAYEELQSTVEELETTNEELQSTNEELETTNEELQSTNEELETMNEELQSTNEELEAINDEFRERTAQLDQLNTFLEHILSSLRGAVIVLDRRLQVDVWNERAADMWGLRADEVQGAHFLGLDIGLPVEQLKQPLRACLAGEQVRDLRLPARTRRGRDITCLVTMTPLRYVRDGVGGVIMVMEDAGAAPRP